MKLQTKIFQCAVLLALIASAWAESDRSRIPFAISDKIWREIESIENYSAWPREKNIKVSYRATLTSQHPVKSRTGPCRPAAGGNKGAACSHHIESITESRAVSPRCAAIVSKKWQDGVDVATGWKAYVCANIVMLNTNKDKSNLVYVSKIDELHGTLFPMQAGAKFMLSYHHNHLSSKSDDTTTLNWEVVGPLPAEQLNGHLAGRAWKLHCQDVYVDGHFNETESKTYDDYYLEDYGIYLSQIGQLDEEKGAYVLPGPGTRIVQSKARTAEDGDETMTFLSYDWEVTDGEHLE